MDGMRLLADASVVLLVALAYWLLQRQIHHLRESHLKLAEIVQSLTKTIAAKEKAGKP